MAILTISREYGSGGREIGRAVSRELGYSYIDRTKILEDIRQAGEKWEKWSETLDEHCPTVWEKYDWSFKGFAALIQSVILQETLKDNVVIMGRGGNFLLRDIPLALRVRINAPIEERMARIVTRESVDVKTARWLIEKTDSERACFISAIYGKRWDDTAEYDMTIDTADSSLDEISSMIAKTLKKKDELKSDKTMELLRMRALAANVKAAIATDASFLIPVFDVFAEEGTVVIRGVVHTPAEHKRIEEAAQKIAGSIPVRCELHYRM
jgi:cytidylate kinase